MKTNIGKCYLYEKNSGSEEELLLLTRQQGSKQPRSKGNLESQPSSGSAGRPRLRLPRRLRQQRGRSATAGTSHAGTALRGRLSNTEKAKHTREARLLALGPGLTPRTRWAAAAARAGAARRCRGPAGWTAATAARCWTATSTVRFLVQVKSSFQLILLFVPSGLPLLLSLHTSNGFSLDPAKNEWTVHHGKEEIPSAQPQDLLLLLQ